MFPSRVLTRAGSTDPELTVSANTIYLNKMCQHSDKMVPNIKILKIISMIDLKALVKTNLKY